MDNKIQEKLDALLLEYSKKLPSKIDDLEIEAHDFMAHPNHKLLETFHRDIHSLCGSSATYGYQALSQAARQLEIYLKILLEKNIEINDEQKNEITCLFENLKPALHLIPREKSSFTNSTIKNREENRLVYIVDHDQTFGHSLKNYLAQSDYDLKQLEDLSDVKMAMEEEQPLAIIADITRTEKEDIAYLAHFRKNQEIPVPLLCVSKDGSLQVRLKGIRAGATAFFQKPIDSFQMSKMLDYLKESSSHESYRILIVDDSISLSEYHALILQEAGMITAVVNNPLQLMKSLVDFQPDLLLMDIYMPECTGLELAAVLRQQPLYTSLPIIFLSSEDDKFKQLSAMSIGGDDFLTKPILPQFLVAAVRSRAKRAGILSSYMMRDSLTELLNHTTILHHVDIELKRAQRNNVPLSFVIMDIDNFKEINDTYGHPMGDYVLRKLAELLLSQLRKTDIIGRYGGDEFAVLLPHTDKEISVMLCNKLREAFMRLQFKAEGVEVPVTFSMGVASYPLVNDPDSMIAAADKALYIAKHQGRNQVVHFEEIESH